MTTHLDFYDDGTNMLRALVLVNVGLVRQGLQQGASHLADEHRKQFELIPDTDWNAKMVKGKRVLTTKGAKKNFGDMYSYKTNQALRKKTGGNLNLKNLITFYLPKESTALYAVVMGGHPTFRPITFENGVAIGHKAPITGTGNQTLDIFDKIEYGETRILSKRERGLFLSSYLQGEIKAPIKTITYKPRNFASKARAIGKARALESIMKLYKNNLPKAVNDINHKYRAEITRAKA